MKEYLADNGYTRIIIEASPFLRTMQTASTFAKILEVPNIQINCVLAKWMRDKKTAEQPGNSTDTQNPFNHLLVSQFVEQKKEAFINKFLNGVDI